MDWFRLGEVGDIESFDAVAIDDKCIAELHREAAWVLYEWSADGSCNFGLERIIEVDDDEILVGEDVGERSGDGDAARAGENSVWIEGKGALEEIVVRIAVEKRADAGHLCFEIGIADDNEAFFCVCDVKKTVHQMNWLLFVFG